MAVQREEKVGWARSPGELREVDWEEQGWLEKKTVREEEQKYEEDGQFVTPFSKQNRNHITKQTKEESNINAEPKNITEN